MKKYIISILIIFISINSSLSQNLDPGLYVLSQNGESYYIKLFENKFRLLKPNSNDVVLENKRNLIVQAGQGKYELSKNTLRLIFDSTIQPIKDFTSDSVNCFISTNSSSKTIDFKINIKFNIPEYGNNRLVIRSYKEDYSYPVKDGSLIVSFPDTIPIKEVKLAVMGYEPRSLPYDPRYNKYIYNYFLNDAFEHINSILAQIWTLTISYAKVKSNLIFRVGNNGYLKKVDEKEEEYLKVVIAENPKLIELMNR